MKMYIRSVLIYYLSNVSLALLQTDLLTKLTKLTKHKGSEMFIKIDKYEYPKINETLRELHKKEWLDYYKCLQKTYADIEYEKIVYPNVLLALEGTSITLKCQICISPGEMHAVNLIEWYFNSSSKNSFPKSLDDMNYVDSSNNEYIIIYNLKLEQAGVYWCEMGDVTGSIYYLHIDDNFKEIDIAYPDTATYPPQAISDESISKYNLKIYTTWTTWSPCSMCDTVGIKLRHGYCTISFLGDLSTYRHVDKNISTINELQKNQYIENKDKHEWNQTDVSEPGATTINETIEIRLKATLSLFNNKLPCKSRFVPKKIQIIPTIKERKTEIMKRYCKKRCPKNIVFQVRDEKNNILESANNSAGIYSMLQRIPEALSFTRSTIYEKHNKKIKLVCPGNLNTNVPIVWQIKDRKIFPSHIKRQSNGRIHLNHQMHIIFESLKFADTNIYSCWQNNKIAGIIKLNVTGGIEFKLNHHVLLIGAIFIIGVFLLVFWRAFKRRLQSINH